MLGPVLLALVLYLVVSLLRRRRRVKRQDTPLGGYDTGVRSAYRVPGRFFRPHKGF